MAITNIPGWEISQDDIGKTPLQVYARVPLVYRCANLIANSASTTPLYLRENDEDIEWLYKTPLKTLVKRMVKDLQLYGRSFVLKVVDGRGNVLNLRRLNPNGMQVHFVGVDDDGDPILRYVHYLGTHKGQMQTKEYSHEEIIYCKYEPESNDIDPDIYPALVALGSGKVLNYLAVFGEKYFDKGAMPTTIVSVPGGASTDEMGRFESWVRRRVSGIRKAFGVLVLGADITVHHLNPPAKDLAIPELDELNRKRVLDAFGVPEGMVEKSANYASAETHTRQFWDMTIQPVTDIVLDALNDQLFYSSDYELVALYEELSVYQVDEARRSAALANLVSAGVSIEGAWYTLGYEELPDDIPLIGAPQEDDRPQRIQETDSSMITDGAVEDVDTSADVIEGKATVPSLFTHLDAWRRKAHNRVRQGKSLMFDFESEYIPVSMKGAIVGVLSETDVNHGDVDHVFDHVIQLHDLHSWKAY